MIPHITSDLECKPPSGEEKAVVGSLSVQVSASSRGMVAKRVKTSFAAQILRVRREQAAPPRGFDD